MQLSVSVHQTSVVGIDLGNMNAVIAVAHYRGIDIFIRKDDLF
jgi:molecular chaperone DnaK (HSP70)